MPFASLASLAYLALPPFCPSALSLTFVAQSYRCETNFAYSRLAKELQAGRPSV